MLAAMFDDDAIAFAQQLSGRLTTVGPGLADLELTADGATPLGSAMRIAVRLSFLTEHRFRVTDRHVLVLFTHDHNQGGTP
jgi:hypothetical protein